MNTEDTTALSKDIQYMREKIDTLEGYMKKEVGDLKGQVAEVYEKLLDNSDKIFKVILEHNKELEEKYVNKEVYTNTISNLRRTRSIIS